LLKFDPEKFNPIYLSLFQMILDLIAVANAGLFYRGNRITALHAICIPCHHRKPDIAGTLVYTMAAVFVLAFAALTTLEHYQVIAHHSIEDF